MFNPFSLLYQELHGPFKNAVFSDGELAQVLSGVISDILIVLRYAIPVRLLMDQEIQVYGAQVR